MNQVSQTDRSSLVTLESISGPIGSGILRFSSQPGWQPGPVVKEENSFAWTEVGPGGLEAKCRLEVVASSKAARMEIELVNTSAEMSPTINPHGLHLWLSDPGTPYSAFRLYGSVDDGHDDHYPQVSFTSQESLVYGGLRSRSSTGGRSSERNLPITLVADAAGNGLWFGLEWSGAWSHKLKTPFGVDEVYPTTDYGMAIEVALQGVLVQLQPGESVKLPALHLGFFEGGFEKGTNCVRRYLRDQVCAKLNGKPMVPPTSYNSWFGLGNEFDESLVRRQVDRAAELGLEYFNLDAGWFAGVFPSGCGNWDIVDAKAFPNGLKLLADYVRSKGMKFGLFIEPERAGHGTSWATKHPEFYINIGKRDSLLMNLARKDAQDFLIEFLDQWIGELGIKWSRWDLNTDLVSFWKEVDPNERVQLDYFAGLYRVWDEVQKRHPDWVLEITASGGRRVDMGSMKRGHTCWLIDSSVSPQVSRFTQLQANRLLPAQYCNLAIVAFRERGDANIGDHDALARMAGAMCFSGDIAAWSDALTKKMADHVAYYKSIRHLLDGDYFRILPTPIGVNDWDAGAFVSRDKKECLLFVFKVQGADSQTLRLKGLEVGQYQVTSRGGEAINIQRSGQQLMEDGLKVRLDNNQGAVIHLRLIKHFE